VDKAIELKNMLTGEAIPVVKAVTTSDLDASPDQTGILTPEDIEQIKAFEKDLEKKEAESDAGEEDPYRTINEIIVDDEDIDPATGASKGEPDFLEMALLNAVASAPKPEAEADKPAAEKQETAKPEEVPVVKASEPEKPVEGSEINDVTLLDIGLDGIFKKGGTITPEIKEKAEPEIEDDLPPVFGGEKEEASEPVSYVKEKAAEASDDFEDEDEIFEGPADDDEIFEGSAGDDDMLLKALTAGMESGKPFDDEEKIAEAEVDEEPLKTDAGAFSETFEEYVDEDAEEEDEDESAAPVKEPETVVEPEPVKATAVSEGTEPEVIVMADDVRDVFKSVANIESLQNQLAVCFNPIAEGHGYAYNYIIRGADDAAMTRISAAVPKFLSKFGLCDRMKTVRAMAADLNEADFGILLERMKDGCLIIKKAHKLNDKAVETLGRYITSGSQEAFLILECDAKAAFVEDHSEFIALFDKAIDIKPYDELDLVGIAKSCVEENGYELSFEASVTLKEHFQKMIADGISIDYEDISDLVCQALRQLDKRNIKNLLSDGEIYIDDESSMITLMSEDFEAVMGD
ncbi:MAG: hypothetical protein K5771_09515, partial [Oscillospiraceae bacterium]|nr:hypothetical protein [Oscillospiraceae bacterium]